MSVWIKIPEKQIRLTRDLPFELFEEIKCTVSNQSTSKQKCEHVPDSTTITKYIFCSDGEHCWYETSQACNKCLSSKMGILVCGGVSFICYVIDGTCIHFDQEWGHGVTISCVPEKAVILWNELELEPGNVDSLQNLIDYYRS